MILDLNNEVPLPVAELRNMGDYLDPENYAETGFKLYADVDGTKTELK